MKKSGMIWLVLSAIVCLLLALYVLLFTAWSFPVTVALIMMLGTLSLMISSYYKNERLHEEEATGLKFQCNTLLSRLNVLHEECASADLQFHKSREECLTLTAALEQLRKNEAALQERGRTELEGLRRASLDETSKCARLEQELKTVLLILAEVVVDLFHAPKNTQGSDLKSLRMRVLDAAYVGFRGLQQFTWATHKKPVEGYLYRDHAQHMLSLGADLSQQWVADYMRYAHGHKPTDDQTGTASQPRATVLESSDDAHK
ncbi:MAG: hypothetical protein WCT54_05480 [Patescibacteria group bacterium]|jgi:hypothetical protein